MPDIEWGDETPRDYICDECFIVRGSVCGGGIFERQRTEAEMLADAGEREKFIEKHPDGGRAVALCPLHGNAKKMLAFIKYAIEHDDWFYGDARKLVEEAEKKPVYLKDVWPK